jgi:hypothetical protein
MSSKKVLKVAKENPQKRLQLGAVLRFATETRLREDGAIETSRGVGCSVDWDVGKPLVAARVQASPAAPSATTLSRQGRVSALARRA